MFLLPALLLGLPLYLLMIIVVLRAGLLNPSGPPFRDEQLKALLAFLGVALTAAATTVGLILSKASSDRSYAQQVADADRQTLETAVRVLDLLKVDDRHADPIVTAGALTTLVHLRHSIIALQILRVALDQDAVDIRSAVWLVDQILTEAATPDNAAVLEASRQDAAELLQDHIRDLTDDGRPGKAEWPSSVFGAWPSGLTVQCSSVLVLGLRQLLLSRPVEWWEDEGMTWSWAITSLLVLAEADDTDPGLVQEAAGDGLLLLKALPEDAAVEWLAGSLARSEAERRLRQTLVRIQVPAEDAMDATDESLKTWVALAARRLRVGVTSEDD